MRNPLISVCMLCYNHEKYVAQSIESILNQTYNNWELIITDNASTDGSKSIIEKYARKNQQIQFYSLIYNSFPSGGLNNCLKYCKGEYVVFLSSDDYFDEYKLEKQLEFMKKENVEISFTWCIPVNDENNKIKGHFIEKLINQSKIDSETIKINYLKGQNSLHAGTPMITKKAHQEIGLYDNRLLQSQDLELWIRFVSKYDIKILEEPLTYYRVRDDGKNLSLNMDENAWYRSKNESFFWYSKVLNFDIEVLKKFFGDFCDHKNKYRTIFDYVKDKDKSKAFSIMMALYYHLGSDFEFPSSHYEDLLYMMSNLDIINEFEMEQQKKQLRILRRLVRLLSAIVILCIIYIFFSIRSLNG